MTSLAERVALIRAEEQSASAHQRREREWTPPRQRATCSVPGCGAPVEGRGLCVKHYFRARRVRGRGR